jgi:hypothetical protein
MASFSPNNSGLSTSVTKAIQQLFEQASASGVTAIDVRSEAERIRSTIAGASVITSDELVSMIGHEGAKLGIGLEFR